MREILAADPALAKLQPRFLRGSLNEGFKSASRPGAGLPIARGRRGLVLVTETEIFGRKRARRSPAAGRAHAAGRAGRPAARLLGARRGRLRRPPPARDRALPRASTKIDTAQGLREVISLEFDDGVTLHVPLQESHLISRYVGPRPDQAPARQDRLRPVGEGPPGRRAGHRGPRRRAPSHPGQPRGPGGLRVPARTRTGSGSSRPRSRSPRRRASCAAIEETKRDMERTRPMDRLICGDVGFGKTEVALRAAFKAVQAGKQVVVLVPTTVLAQQHLNTFRERMAGYPVVDRDAEPVPLARPSRGRSWPPLAAGRGGHPDRDPPPAAARRRAEGPRPRHHRRGAALRREAQGGLQDDAGDGRRALDERDADPADALPRPDERARHERHRHAAGQPPPDPDDREDLRREGRGRRRSATRCAAAGQVFYLHNRVGTIDLVADSACAS